jgi:hypothetical protein
MVDETATRITSVSLTNTEIPQIVFTAENGELTLVSTTLSAEITEKIQIFAQTLLRDSIMNYLPKELRRFIEFQELFHLISFILIDFTIPNIPT